MRCLIACMAFVISALSFADTISDLKLISLKPNVVFDLKIGTLSASLIDLESRKELMSNTVDLGDCKTCSRGVAINHYIGIRIVGSDINKLKIERKQSGNTKIVSCSNKNHEYIKNTYSCEVEINNHKYKLSLLIK